MNKPKPVEYRNASAQVRAVFDDIKTTRGVKDVNVELTFTPPWDPRTMASDEIKMQLGIW